MMPRRPKTNASFASSAANRTSNSSESVRPAPTAAPFSAPITGVAIVQKADFSAIESESTPSSSSCSACASAPNEPPPAERSTPAQNPLPAPVTTIARTASSASNSHMASKNSRCIVRSKALRASGRLSVSVATPTSSTSTMIVSWLMGRVVSGLGELVDRQARRGVSPAGEGRLTPLRERGHGLGMVFGLEQVDERS